MYQSKTFSQPPAGDQHKENRKKEAEQNELYSLFFFHVDEKK